MKRRLRKWKEWRKLTGRSRIKQILVLLGLEKSDHFDRFVVSPYHSKSPSPKKRTRGDAIRCMSDERLAELFTLTFVKGAFLAFEEFHHRYDGFEQYMKEDEAFKQTYPSLLSHFIDHLKGEDDGENCIR